MKKVLSKFILVKNIYKISDNHGGIFNRNVSRLCAIIVLLTPPSYWYTLTFRTYQFSTHLNFMFKNESENFEHIRLKLFYRMATLLKRTDVAFHVPYQFNSNQVSNHPGVLYCSMHLPLIEVAIKVLIENNYGIEAAIAAKTSKDLTISILGMAEKFPAIKVGPNTLLKTKSILTKGSSVIVLVDRLALDDLSPNSMKICRLSSAKVVFVFTKLEKHGVIHCWLEEAPFPYCNNNLEIQENLEYLKRTSLDIMQTYMA